MPLVYTTTEGQDLSSLELSTPSQNVARPLAQDLARIVGLLGGPQGSVKGVAKDGVAGVLTDLAGFQISPIWRRATVQDVPNAVGLLDITLVNTTTILRVQSTGDVTLRSMSGPNDLSPEGREVLITHDRLSGSGMCTLGHNMAGVPVGFAPFFNPELKPIVLGQTSGYIARGFFGRWRSNTACAASVPIVVPVPPIIAQTLAYVDVSLVGTPLEGTPANAIVSAAPRVDLAAAALLAGFYIGCRMSALNTLRFSFWGALLGGNATFSVATL